MRTKVPWFWLTLGGFLLGVLLLISFDPEFRTVRNGAQDILGYGGPHSDEGEPGRDLFHSGAAIGGRKAGLTYSAFDQARDATATFSFFGFGCASPCTDHVAGYRWAVRNQARRISQCVGSNWSHVEGCAAFVLPKYDSLHPG